MGNVAIMTKLLLESKDFESKMLKAGQSVNKLSGLSKVGGAIIGGAFTLAAGGVALLTRELFKDVQAAAQVQQVEAQLNAVLKSTGQIAGVTADQVKKYADAKALLTGIDDEAIISAQSLLLTFTDVGKDVFPMATDAALDMATALNSGVIPSLEQLKSTTILIGKALQDPDAGLGALKRVGVNVDELSKKFTPLMTKEQKQILILQELATEFGGSAEAAGKTFAGQIAIAQMQLGNIRETIGKGLLPVLSRLAIMFNEYLARPETLAFIQAVSDRLSAFAGWAVTQLPIVAGHVRDLFGWLMDNQGVIVGAVAAIGVAVMSFVIPAFISFVSAAWPVIAIMGAVALAGYFLHKAWVNNFGGIQQIVKRFAAFALDAFFRIRFHLVNALPGAIVYLKNAWEKNFLPIIKKVVEWCKANLMPFISALANLLAVSLPLAIKIAGYAFINYLWPVLKTVGTFLVQYFLWGLKNIGSVLDWLTKKIIIFTS
jgi:hypothetical protein